jgi:hypothetical protein
MKKKFLMSLAPLLAITALAVVPAAQAAPHYWVNGAKLKEGVANTKTSIAWGTITLKGTKGGTPGNKITCHNAAAGTAFNPELEAAGEGLTQVFATFDCEQEFVCPAKTTGVAVTAEKLPWTNKLTEEVVGTIRQETNGVKVQIECFEGGIKIASIPFVIGATEKGQRPNSKSGTSALHPGFLEFDSGSGELEVEGSAGTITGKTEGVVKVLGYNAQELIVTKNP